MNRHRHPVEKAVRATFAACGIDTRWGPPTGHYVGLYSGDPRRIRLWAPDPEGKRGRKGEITIVPEEAEAVAAWIAAGGWARDEPLPVPEYKDGGWDLNYRWSEAAWKVK